MEKSSYKKFVLMLVISFFVMYAIMYLNVDRFDHFYINMTRFNMTLLMVSAMALLMFGMMRTMYQDRKLNSIIAIAAVAVFILALIGVRTQTAIGDVQYMKGMIPHHSIAIMVSKNAHLKDPEVKKLAQSIIDAQEKEITQMKMTLARMDKWFKNVRPLFSMLLLPCKNIKGLFNLFSMLLLAPKNLQISMLFLSL